MADEITGHEDILDSRDIIERIEELTDALDITAEEVMPGTAGELEDIRNELEMLESIKEQAEAYCPDWEYGVTLINSDYWPTYAEELVKDVGDLPKDLPRYIAIDWDATANALLVDYTTIELRHGATYYAR